MNIDAVCRRLKTQRSRRQRADWSRLFIEHSIIWHTSQTCHLCGGGVYRHIGGKLCIACGSRVYA